MRVCGIKINKTETKYAFCIFECIKTSAMSDIALCICACLLQRERKKYRPNNVAAEVFGAFHFVHPLSVFTNL